MADLWHVDAGGQQVYGNGDIRVTFVLVLADQLLDLVALAGDLGYCGLVVFAVIELLEGLIQQALDHISVQVGGAENQCFFIAKRV